MEQPPSMAADGAEVADTGGPSSDRHRVPELEERVLELEGRITLMLKGPKG